MGKIKVRSEKFTCQREGLKIGGTAYMPEFGNRLPIVILSHGFMANQSSVKKYAGILAALGYAAFTFDFCGGSVFGGKSDKKTTAMSVRTEVRDLKAVIEFVKTLEYTDETSITLLGCSQGGFVSAITAAELQEQIANLILFYPALCIPDDARNGHMMWAKFDPENIPSMIKCGPMKLGRCYVEDVLHMDPYEAIRDYQGNVCIIHGTKDEIVNISYARKAYEEYAACRTGENILYLREIAGGTHGFRRRADKEAVEAMKDFIAKV